MNVNYRKLLEARSVALVCYDLAREKNFDEISDILGLYEKEFLYKVLVEFKCTKGKPLPDELKIMNIVEFIISQK